MPSSSTGAWPTSARGRSCPGVSSLAGGGRRPGPRAHDPRGEPERRRDPAGRADRGVDARRRGGGRLRRPRRDHGGVPVRRPARRAAGGRAVRARIGLPRRDARRHRDAGQLARRADRAHHRRRPGRRPAGHRRHHDRARAGRRGPRRGAGEAAVAPLRAVVHHDLPVALGRRLDRGSPVGPPSVRRRGRRPVTHEPPLAPEVAAADRPAHRVHDRGVHRGGGQGGRHLAGRRPRRPTRSRSPFPAAGGCASRSPTWTRPGPTAAR